MKRLFILIIIFSASVLAQTFKKTGTAGFVFLEVPTNARYAALGESGIALHDFSADAIFNNPAALGFSNHSHSFAAGYSPWIADIKHLVSAYSFQTDFGVLAVGVNYMDFGSMQRTRKSGSRDVYIIDGTFSANAIAAGLSFSKRLTDRFSFGLTIKYVKETIDIYSADNYLFDGGILYFTGLGSLRIAALIQNFGVDAKFNNDQFKMPSVLKLGAAAEILGSFESEYRITAIAEALHPNDGEEKLNTGLELSWRNTITLRAGYKFFYDEESLSFGVGLNPNIGYPLNIDFAFADYGRLGNVLRFGIQLGY